MGSNLIYFDGDNDLEELKDACSEYNYIMPWISFRELDEDMVEEAEAAGELFLKQMNR